MTDSQHNPFYSYLNQVIYYPTYTRLDGLLVGVMIGLISRLRPQEWAKLSKLAIVLPFAGVAFLALAFYLSQNRFGFCKALFTYPILTLGFWVFSSCGKSADVTIFKATNPWFKSHGYLGLFTLSDLQARD